MDNFSNRVRKDVTKFKIEIEKKDIRIFSLSYISDHQAVAFHFTSCEKEVRNGIQGMQSLSNL